MKFDDAISELEAHFYYEAAQVLRDLRVEQKRNRSPRRPTVSRKVTPEIAEQIRHLHTTTTLTTHQIAAQLCVNQGRVSEVLNGEFVYAL